MNVYEKTADVLEKLASLLADGEHVVTLILGAGASASVAPLTDTIRTTLLEKGGIPIEVLDTHAQYSFGRFSAKNCTLEELFSIYTHLKELKGEDPEKAIPDFLRKEKIKIPSINFKELPPTGYEYVAHLIHHKCIANIITPNFDELLELSLNDEMGEEEYRLTTSLSEFGAFRDLIEKWEKEPEELYEKPNLIKIHGTISKPLTLRWTIEKVKSFEKAKSGVLKRIFEDTGIMIIAGYSFRDTDLKNVFFETVKNRQSVDKLQVYWIDAAEAGTFIKDNEVYERLTPPDPNKKIELHCVNCNSDKFFADLARSLAKEDGTQPTIARHKVREQILFLKRQESKSTEPSLDMWKLLTEVIIYAIKTKGLFDLTALSRCRRNENYCKRLSQSPREVLHKLIKHGILEIVTLDEHEIYFVPGDKDVDSTLQAVSAKIKNLFEFDLWSTPEITSLKGYLDQLKCEFDIDVGPPDESLRLMFYSPEFTVDHKTAIKRGNTIIENAIESLLIVAETGEWLARNDKKDSTRDHFKNFLKKEKTKAKLILSAPILGEHFFNRPALHTLIQKEKLQELKGIEREVNEEQRIEKQRIEIKYLLWDEHIYHMILNEKEGHFYSRVGKSTTINPVYISKERKQEDYSALSSVFNRLWHIARYEDEFDDLKRRRNIQ